MLLLRASPKRLAMFHSIQQENKMKSSLKPLWPTRSRWTCRAKAIQYVPENYQSLIEVLQSITEEGGYSGGVKVSSWFVEKHVRFWGFLWSPCGQRNLLCSWSASCWPSDVKHDCMWSNKMQRQLKNKFAYYERKISRIFHVNSEGIRKIRHRIPCCATLEKSHMSDWQWVR